MKTTNYRFIAGFGGLATLACGGPADLGEQAFMKYDKSSEKPANVILINLDDCGFGDFSYSGAVGYQTPNVDRMANEGLIFSNYYSAQPVSGASRSALLTGCYSNRVGLTMAPMPNSPIGINESEEIISELLKDNGYSTAIFGKWHLGDAEEFLPPHHGFDEYVGLPYSNDMWPGHPTMKFKPLPLYDGLEVVKTIDTYDDQAELTTLYTEKTIDFIRRKNKEDKPFFVYLAHNMPHVPLAVSDKFAGKSGVGLYGDVMMELDWSVGEILSTLEELGIEDETLIIFTSDNGPWSNYGNHAGSSGGFREGKNTTFNGGLRVPCIFYMPGHIKPGVCNELISNIDFLPTIADFTSSKLPEQKIDGVSFIPYLTGAVKESPRDYLCLYFSRNSLEAVTDGRFKLVFPHYYNSYEENAPGMDGQPGRMARKQVTEMEFYDLRQDPGERRNIIGTYPEIEAELQKVADQIRYELGDDLTGVKGAENRSPGRAANVEAGPQFSFKR